eukprot:scaffold82054_cov28-Tisochrysis_lutea.AAC.3
MGQHDAPVVRTSRTEFWALVASQLGNGRSADAVRQQWRRLTRAMITSGGTSNRPKLNMNTEQP